MADNDKPLWITDPVKNRDGTMTAEGALLYRDRGSLLLNVWAGEDWIEVAISDTDAAALACVLAP